MMRIRKCDKCTNYSMQKVCPKCGGATSIAKPPKYSPEDKYGSYRRQAKEEAEQDDSDIIPDESSKDEE